MILMEDIRKRQIYKNMKHILYEYNVDLLLENCRKTNSISIIETYFNNWPYDINENRYEFSEAANILQGFVDRTKNNCDKNKAINLFIEMVIPKASDMKAARKVVESLNMDNSLMLEECNKYITADRIMNNHTKLIKRGIDNLLQEASLSSEDGIDEYVTKVCEHIDNIEMPFPTKYNVALENTLYLLDIKGIKYDRKNILESINDYFLVNTDQSKIEQMNIILKESDLYSDLEKDDIINKKVHNDPEEIDDLDIVLDADEFKLSLESATDKSSDIINQLKTIPNKTPELFKSIIRKLYTKSPENIVEETPNFLIWMRKFLVFSTLAISPYLTVVTFFVDMAIQTKLQQKETQKILNSFKREKEKCENKLYKCKNEKQKERLSDYIKQLEKSIYKLEEYEDTLYTEKENDERRNSEMNESADFENYITLKEYIEKHHSSFVSDIYSLRRTMEVYLKSKYLKLYNSNCILFTDIAEIKKFEHSNINSILHYIGCDNRIYVDIAKILPIRYKELTNTDMDCTDIITSICKNVQPNDNNLILSFEGDEDMYTLYLSLDLPIILDMEDDNIIEEQVHNSILNKCAAITVLEEQVSKISEKDVEYLLSFVDDNIDRMDMDTVDCVGQFSVVASDIINPKQLLDIFEENAQTIRKSTAVDKYTRLAKIQVALASMKGNTAKNNKYLSLYDTYRYNSILSESLDLLEQITINETSFMNSMKMAQRKLKDNITKLSDKEKQLSRQLDYAVDSIVQKMQMTVTNNNREAVIKGSIIPSASKILKIAITTGAVFAINPAIAVVGLLGGLAASKHATNKERQYILDEIEIQMKVVEKKIQLADRADDMKSMEQLLKIEKKLKREKSRIEYHKKDYVPVRKDD